MTILKKEKVGINIHNEKSTNIRWQVFMMLLVVVTINYVDRAVLSIAMPVIAEDLNLNPAMTGIILSSFFWGYALMQIPSGIMADRFRPAGLVVGSTIVWGIVQTFTGFVNTSKMFIFLRTLLGITESPVYPGGAKLQSQWLTSKERGRGASLLDSGSPLGTAIGGPIIIAFMAWFGGWRGALIATGILTILIGLVAMWFIRGTPSTNPRVNKMEREYLKNAFEEENKAEKKQNPISIGFKEYLKNKTFWFMCIAWFFYCTVYYGLMTWGPLYLAHTQNLDINSLGSSIFIIFGAGFIGALVGGWITDTWLKKGGSHNIVMKTILSITGIMTSISIFVLTQITTTYLAITLLAIALFFLRWGGIFWTVPATIAQRKHVGIIGGCIGFSGNLAGIVTPLYIGIVVSITDSYFLTLMLFVVAGLIFTGCILLMNYAKKIGSET